MWCSKECVHSAKLAEQLTGCRHDLCTRFTKSLKEKERKRALNLACSTKRLHR